MAKTIADYKSDYASARAAGDSAGMKAANDGANAIRASSGQAAEYASQDISNVSSASRGGGNGGGSSRDYSSVVYDQNASLSEKQAALNQRYSKETQMRAAGTWDDRWASTSDLQSMINNQWNYSDPYGDAATAYQGMIQKNNDQAAELYRSMVQQGTDRLNSQRGTINTQYDDAARQAYIGYMQGQKNTPQQMAALGMTGGASESSMIQQQSAYQNNVNSVNTARQKALQDIDNAIIDLQNSGDVQTAQYILNNADKIADNYVQSLYAGISRRDTLNQQDIQNAYQLADLTGVYRGQQTLGGQQVALQNKQFEQDVSNSNFDKALALMEYGLSNQQIADNLGVTVDEVNRMISYIKAQSAKSGGGGSGRSRSGYASATSYGDSGSAAPTQTFGDNYDLTSISNLGYGPISKAELESLIQQGKVGTYKENGKIKVYKIQEAQTGTPKAPSIKDPFGF